MRGLEVRRHAESVANAQRRLRGPHDDDPLTDAGCRDADELAFALRSRDDITGIWTSDTRRARQTAAPVAATLGVPIRTTPVFREVGIGALGGHTHDQAAREKPAEYAAWTARGDLDPIPGAEPGEQVQARALAALAVVGRAMASDTETHLAFTHGAFLRVLVNTHAGRERHMPVAVGHTDSHVLAEPWESLDPRPTNRPTRLPTFRVDCAGGISYLVKWLHGPADEAATARFSLRQDIARRIETPPELVIADDPTPLDGPVNVTVRRYIPGTPVGLAAHSRDVHQLVSLFSRVNHALSDGTDQRRRSLPHISSYFQRATSKLPDAPEARRLQLLQEHHATSRLLVGNTVIADLDLHRDNVIRCDDGTLRKIDFDSLVTAPAGFAEACAILGSCLLYAPTASANELIATLHAINPAWPANANLADILTLVEVRVLLGLSHFREACRVDPRGSEPYLHLYRTALDYVGAMATQLQITLPS